MAPMLLLPPLFKPRTVALSVAAVLLLTLGAASAAEPAADDTSPSQPPAGERETKLTAEPAPPPPALLPPAPAAPSPAVVARGRHLSRDCTSCHRIDGVENGIPGITGWSAERLAAALDGYRTGARRNPVMGSVARTLSADEVEALGAYYASLKR
ncbi:MAG: hypothetical protein EKK41_03675 [Hyphomicrobiales bacterium]|nr:MAG: hypothetical protein EKK41_03675 [Hyphomicrobiales bacterium]